ncbi:MAG: hypothetical protein BWY74_02865 [Firmicutes bacterium ADurb.Bin419]|nr:MAG: hypothetical protein BWY74_02865 [Firmicutes bacterium ADurb.Bin419]
MENGGGYSTIKPIFQALLVVLLLAGCNNTSQVANEPHNNDFVTKAPENTIQSTPSIDENLYEPSYTDIKLKTDVSDFKEISKTGSSLWSVSNCIGHVHVSCNRTQVAT